MDASEASLKPAQDALLQLKAALAVANPSDLERDGTIQRFEYSYEMIWKLSQRVLKDNEISAETPKAVFRELGRLGWISNVEEWLDFQKIRKETSHEYGDKLAKKSYALAKVFLPLAEALLEVLKRNG
jgi:nucleotidyltransferase substrate binding protein (TIGR01987 family)